METYNNHICEDCRFPCKIDVVRNVPAKLRAIDLPAKLG